MLLSFPENFSENGARPVQILGRHGRLIGWARSFSDFMTVTDKTIVGGGLPRPLTRIAGRDVSPPDGHTVGKTFSRKGFLGCLWQHSLAGSAESASNHLPASSQDRHQSLDPSRPRRHQSYYLQDGARETGLGHWLPGFLRSNPLSTYSLKTPDCSPPCPKETHTKSNKTVDASHSRKLVFSRPAVLSASRVNFGSG